MLRLFQDKLIFGEVNSSNFFRVTASIQQSIFSVQFYLQSSCLFDELFLQNTHFFAADDFPGKLLFQSETSTKQLLFGTVTFFLQKSFFFEAGTSVQQQLIHKSYSQEKAYSSEKQYSALHTFFQIVTFLKQLFFQKTLLSIAATFFEELLFHKILFQKRYYLTVRLSFHRYTSFLSVNN